MTRTEALIALALGETEALPPEPDFSHLEVPGEGPLDAPLVVVAESLGHEEVEGGRPLIGRSGRKLRRHAALAGVNLTKARLENVYPMFPPGGSITNVSGDELTHWQANCRQRVRAMPNITLIVAVGNVSLETFTGLRDISRRRGSVYEWEGKKVLAMIHPAAILRAQGKASVWEKACRLDWERVKLLMTPHSKHGWYCGCGTQRSRYFLTPYTTPDVDMWNCIIQTYILRAQHPTEILAIDIETPKQSLIHGERVIECVAFAFGPGEALVLPFRPEYRDTINQLCDSPCIKVGHNLISFDHWWLKRSGIPIRGEIRDTMAMSHALDPASSHKLEFLIARYLWEPWYKDEGQEHDAAKIADWAQYYAYAGKDVCCERELHDILWPQLEARGMMAFYEHHYRDMFPPMLDLSLQGVPVDHAARKALLTEALHTAHHCRDALGRLVGKPLFTVSTRRDKAVLAAVQSSDPTAALGQLSQTYPQDALQESVEKINKKTVSNRQLVDLLYNQLGLPEQLKHRKNGEYTPTADGLTLRTLRRQYGVERPDVAEIIDLVLKHNKHQKLASFCYDNHFDTDGRFRFSLGVGTEAARLASWTAPNGRGSNGQNLPRDPRFRRLFLPEPGHVLLKFDLSNVEGRFCYFYCYLLTKDPEAYRRAMARGHEWDGHRHTAVICGLAPDMASVSRDARQIAKNITHGAQRSMEALRLAHTLMSGSLDEDGNWNEAYIKSEAECEAYLRAWHRDSPWVREWHAHIRKEVRQRQRLTSPSGRVWDVRYEEINDELFRRAYSWQLQRSNAEHMNQRGFIPLWYWLREQGMESRILLHEHDELVCSCPVNEVYDVAQFAGDHLEAPVELQGASLVIPVEFACGRSWGETTSFRELPTREVFEAHAKEIMRKE